MEWNEYSQEVKKAMEGLVYDKEIVDILMGSIDKGQTIYLAGNGGSAAISLHLACDFSKGASHPNWLNNPRRYRAVSLNGSTSYITAIANDNGYDEIFKQQLVGVAKPKDILFLISSSGNSPNIVKAAEYGKELEMIVMGLTGFKGGKLRELANFNAYVNADSYEVTEDVHAAFGSYLTRALRGGSKL